MHPTLFHVPSPFGAVAVHAFGVSLALAVLVGWYLLRRDPAMRTETAGRLYFVVVLTAIVGARALYVATLPRAVRAPFDIVALGDGGLVAFGAVPFVLALRPLLLRYARAGLLDVPLERFAARLALPALVGASIVCVGAYLAGSDFGRPLAASAPRTLRVLGTFPAAPVREGAIGRFVADGPPVLVHQRHAFPDRLAADAATSLPTHPVQLYEAALFALFALGLYALERRGGERAQGLAAPLAALAYAIVRLVTEPFRGDPERVRLGPTTLPVALGVAMALAALAIIAVDVLRARRARNTSSTPAA